MTRRPRGRELDPDQLRQVRGGGILLPALGQAKETRRAELEEIPITCEELVRQR